MSIFPKRVIKGENKFTTFHMKICNNSSENIIGQIKYKIFMPNGQVDEFYINRNEEVRAKSELNEYDKYFIKDDFVIGRYFVEGTFEFDGMNILSETNENDFFDIIEEVENEKD